MLALGGDGAGVPRASLEDPPGDIPPRLSASVWGPSEMT